MNTVLRFIACSDLHFKTDSEKEPQRFRRGMALAYAYADSQAYRGIDAIVFNGDFANQGLQEQMQLVKDTVSDCVRPETQTIYTLASHEFMAPDGEAGAVARFQALFGQAPDQHNVINGYHFISITTQNGCHIYDEKQAWLREQLRQAAADYPKPIFVFQHPHLTGTVYGSILWGEDEIIPILMDYPGVIDFSGHSHAPINDPRSIHQKYFTSEGTGSLSYLELDEFDKLHGTIPPDAENFAQFCIVEARDDGSVLIRPFDVISGGFFGTDRLIAHPWEPASFVYTDDRYQTAACPAFTADAELRVTSDAAGEYAVGFPQALQEPERVDSYTLRLRSLSDGRIIRQCNVTSSYYLYRMPPRVEIPLGRLCAGAYEATVCANSFWGTSSAPLTLTFEVNDFD